jgi:TPP-dependent pyruvate/acetoin dehydrogenase alpha subunit
MSDSFGASGLPLGKDTLLRILISMVRVRECELAIAEMSSKGEVICPVHLYVGQEAIACGVCAALNPGDYTVSTHRSHGHFLAKGGSMRALFAEVLGRRTGASSGHGGSMHLTAPEVGFIGSSAIVAGSIPIAVGAALAARQLSKERVSVAFFGDGATDEGVFYESINLAVLYRLPVIFVCENNRFSTHMPDHLRQGNPDIASRLQGFKIAVSQLDGNDPIAVYLAAKDRVKAARDGGGPALLECLTYRWLAHVGPTVDEDVGYRRKVDIEYWRGRCPIVFLRHRLEAESALDSAAFETIECSAKREVQESIAFARSSDYPVPEDVEWGR